MIIDNRKDEKDKLYPLLSNIAKCRHLEFGDVFFIGNGEGGKKISIGIERKTISDYISSFTSGRLLGHQIPGLLRDYERVYLVVEGDIRVSRSGIVQVRYGSGWVDFTIGGRGYTFREFICSLNSFSELCGIVIYRTRCLSESAYLIRALYHWWNDKEYDEHRISLKTGTPIKGIGLTKYQDIVGRLPGVGAVKLVNIEKYFNSDLERTFTASEEEWRLIDGIGKKLASNIRSFILGEKQYEDFNGI